MQTYVTDTQRDAHARAHNITFAHVLCTLSDMSLHPLCERSREEAAAAAATHTHKQPKRHECIFMACALCGESICMPYCRAFACENLTLCPSHHFHATISTQLSSFHFNPPGETSLATVHNRITHCTHNTQNTQKILTHMQYICRTCNTPLPARRPHWAASLCYISTYVRD